MKLLILGGTQFLGPHLVAGAQAAGHEVTLFNRGRTAPGSLDVEEIHGDRRTDLAKVSARSWDAVVDTSGYFPAVVRASAETLADAGRYLFVSSVSVYRDMSLPGPDESSAVGELEDPAVEEVRPETYGPLKAACENAVVDVFGERSIVVRPGLIVGPRDPSDRFTYWPVRISRSGSIVAPGPREGRAQFIDVRDLADWMVSLLASEQSGVFNASGPSQPLTFGTFLDTVKEVVGPEDAELVWLTPEQVAEQRLAAWTELPVWLPPDPQVQGMQHVSIARALESGLTFRPLGETVQDTLAWWLGAGPPERPLRAGLPPEKEKAALAALGLT